MRKQLPLSHDTLLQLVSEYPTPFYLYDERAIRANATRLKQAFDWNPGYHQYFAVKATPNPHILQLFQEEGCGVDCASETELLLARACGFRGEDIMFTSNATPARDYRTARSLDATINLDDVGHLDFLENCAGLPELICFRYNPGTVITYNEAVILDFKDSKFGSTKAQIIDAIQTLSRRGIRRFAIHAQFGAHRREAEYFGTHSALLFDLAVDIYEATGIKTEFINIAGGIGIPFSTEDAPSDIEHISAAIRHAYEDSIVRAGLDPISLYSEFGLFMTGPYGYFVSSVLHVKHTYKNFAGLDASTHCFMNPARYNHYHHITVIGKENDPVQSRYDVTGALCESRDRFAADRLLPELEQGDLLVFHDAGAYAYSHGNQFNGKLRPAELLLCMDGSVRQIRRAETTEDYFATLDFPGL